MSAPRPEKLCGVPETMLWTLHNRASESARRDAMLHDPEAERIYRSIDYDYVRSFGTPDGSHAVRSLMFDEVVGDWMRRHPGGTVVELGSGLETQYQRLDDGKVRWVCVDVPEAIAVRERFLAPDARCRHVALSALDTRWIDEVAAATACSGNGRGANGQEADGRAVFVTAQGLLMYFTAGQVRTLLQAMAARLPGAECMFDTIPAWFSRMTTSDKGLWRTPHYRAPAMPWGIAPPQLAACLHAWLPGPPALALVRVLHYRRFRGFPAMLMPWLGRLPGLRGKVPAMVHLRFGGGAVGAVDGAGAGARGAGHA